jgi:hypothetical protein
MANDCSSYSPQGSINGQDAANAFAGYGACTGANALITGVMDSSVVRSVEASIQAGTAAAAELTGTITMGLSVLSNAGVDIAAASSVVPVVGIALAVVLSVANALQSLFGDGPQIYVPNPNASPGSNTVAWNGSVWEKVSTKVYVTTFISNAMNWINDPANMAVVVGTETTPGMTPAQFSAQHNIFLDWTVPAQLATSSLDSVANPLGGQNQYAVIASSSSPPPGAYEMLRAVQLPVAAAVVAAMPTFANYLTANNMQGIGAPLLARFPALQPPDMIAIFNANAISGPQGAYTIAYGNARDWTNGQCPPPSAQAIQQQFNLPYGDACALLQAWQYVGQGGCSVTVAPPCPPQTPIYKIAPGYGPGGGGFVVGGSGGSTGTPVKSSSAVSRVAVGATVIGVGVLLYHVFVGGYTFYSTGKALVHGTKKVYSTSKNWIEKKFHKGRRKNPLQLGSGAWTSAHLQRTSATGGRDVAYRVDLNGDNDRIAMTKSGAMFFRNEKLITKFKASRYQKTKIRSGTGEVLIFTDQLTE